MWARCASQRRKNHVDPAGLMEGRREGGRKGGRGVCADVERLELPMFLTEMDGGGSVDLRMWEEQRKLEGSHDGQPGV